MYYSPWKRFNSKLEEEIENKIGDELLGFSAGKFFTDILRK